MELVAHPLHLALDLLVDLPLELLHLLAVGGAEVLAYLGPLGLHLGAELLHFVPLLLGGLHLLGHLPGLVTDALAFLDGELAVGAVLPHLLVDQGLQLGHLLFGGAHLLAELRHLLGQPLHLGGGRHLRRLLGQLAGELLQTGVEALLEIPAHLLHVA